MTDKLSFIYIRFLALFLLIIITTRTESTDDSFINSEIDNFVLYFDEWRFDWDHLNDFDNDYHDDWVDIINENNQKTYGCTHNLQTINKKLCILQTESGDFIFQFKNSNNNIKNKRNNHKIKSNMISSAKSLSDYYDNIKLQFDDDNYWSSIQSIDGINGYEAIKKCQPFTFMELCAVYNPYADNLNIHAKIANFRKRRNAKKTNLKKEKISNANSDYQNVYDIDDIDDDDYDDNDEISIDEVMSFAMKDYDDTLGYSYWRGNTLGFDKFDEHHAAKTALLNDANFDDTFGGHTYYFNEMSFNWDDSRDWVSFSKQTTSNTATAKIEEVGAHPDKLEAEVGAHPKQAEVGGAGSGKETESKIIPSGTSPSRSYTKCTGAIPFVHKHACVTISARNAHVHLTAASKEEINILYNGLDDIFNEMGMDQDIEEEGKISNKQQQDNDKVDNAYIEIDDMDDEDDYDEYDDGGRRRLRALYDDMMDDMKDEMDVFEGMTFDFNNDDDWDEIIHSYGFNNVDEGNFGRFGSKRSKIEQKLDDVPSAAVQAMMNNIDTKKLRPKLMLKTLPFLFPAMNKCVHTKVAKLCLKLDVHRKIVNLDVSIPRVGQFFKCIKHPKKCQDKRFKNRLKTGGKGIFNGIKKGMGLIRQIGRRNRYKKKRKHLKKALKQIRKIRKHLKHLTRQIHKALVQSAAYDIDENLYDEDDDDAMAQKVFDENDERGLLLYAQTGTNDFNDIWDDDNQWNAIEEMTTWDGRGITRKCLTIWKKRLCLCQFLGWLDGPEKYHCLFPHHETFNGYHTNTNSNQYENVHVKNVNPKIIVHHFHHIYGAKTIENNLEIINGDTIYPQNKPNWMPLWMWQEMKNQQQNEQISKVLYSAKMEDDEEDENDDIYDDEEDLDEDFNKESGYSDAYEDALNQYYYNSLLYDDYDDEDRINLNEIEAVDDAYDADDEYEENMKQDAWIELSESATHDFDTEWEDDEHWDEIMDIKTWEGTAIKRKCLHLWKHRLCLCQFLGWMDTNKYQCIYHHRSWHPLSTKHEHYNHVTGHLSDTKKEPHVVIHDHFIGGNHGPIIHHFVGHPDTAQYAIHHFHHYGPFRGRRRRRKRKIINMAPERPIKWQVHSPVIVHHFHHVIDEGDEGEYGERGEHGKRKRMNKKGKGRMRRDDILKKKESALKERENAEKLREKKFQDLLWKDRHAHTMWKLMQKPHEPILKKTATGRHMIVAQHINPHGRPIMVSMHKHMPNERPQWMPQGLFTNLKHKGYYMVHSHDHGDHSTVTKDEDRYVHGSDIVPQGAKIEKYDVYDNYYYTDFDDDDEEEEEEGYDDEATMDYDDEYYYNTEYDKLFDFDKIYDTYNDEKYEDDDEFGGGRNFVDEFVDNLQDEWVITDMANALETAFYKLFGGKDSDDDDDEDDGYWDSMEELETKKGGEVKRYCVNIFDRSSCLCGYNKKQYHCNKKQVHRHKYYLDTRMPKDTPQWMSAHDFEWLKDQRLSAFTELLPDPLMKHMEYNQLFTIPFNALSKLVDPAVKMEHIEWHKDNTDNKGVSSAQRVNNGDYYDYDYDDDDDNNNYGFDWYSDGNFDGDDNGYFNEYGDYIIDEFYNKLDGTKWVVTNEYTTDLNDDDMQIFSAAVTTNNNNMNNNNMNTQTQTSDAARHLSSKCMLVFGRNVCLCEFINWVYDHSGSNPLYRCYSSGSPQQSSMQQSNANTNINNNDDTAHKTQVINSLTDLQKQVADTRQKIDQLLAKSNTATQHTATATNQYTKATSHEGWGSKIADYGYFDNNNDAQFDDEQYNDDEQYDDEQYDDEQYDDEQYDDDDEQYDVDEQFDDDEQYDDNDDELEDDKDSVYDGFDQFYDDESDVNNNDDIDDDMEDMNDFSVYDDDDYDDKEEEEDMFGDYNGYDLNNKYDVEIKEEDDIKPNWRTEGDGFTQTLFIGINTFWGLILLSLFFGMISCSLICAFLNFKRLFCKNGVFSMTGNHYKIYDDVNINKLNIEYQTDDGLHTIDEDENVKFNVNDKEIENKQYQNE